MFIRSQPLPFTVARVGDEPPRRSPFTAAWSKTLELLDRELWHLGATDAVVQIDLRPEDFRRDGWPKERSRPGSPVVVFAIETAEHGPLKYTARAFDRWQDNLRAIALGLEALRKVDRYGITERGEQYSGFKALPSAGGSGAGDPEHGARLVEQHGSIAAALKVTHPDTPGTGNVGDFRAVDAFRKRGS